MDAADSPVKKDFQRRLLIAAVILLGAAIPVLAHHVLSKRWSQGVHDDAAATALGEILEAPNVPV